MKRFWVENFGCRAEQADGAALDALLAARGLEPASGFAALVLADVGVAFVSGHRERLAAGARDSDRDACLFSAVSPNPGDGAWCVSQRRRPRFPTTSSTGTIVPDATRRSCNGCIRLRRRLADGVVLAPRR